MSHLNTLSPRRGISLLEVLLALAILATAATLLSQLMQIALRSAAEARDEPRAVLWCESRLNEVSARILLPTSVQNAPLPEDREWVYSLETSPGPYTGLLLVRASVARAATPDSPMVSLSRWIIDPNDQRFLSTATSSTTGTTSSSSSSSLMGGGAS